MRHRLPLPSFVDRLFIQIMHLSLVSVLFRSANELFPANGTQRSSPLVNALDVDEQVGPLTVGSIAHGARVADFVVDALDVGREDFARVVDFVANDAFQFSFDVGDETMIAQSVFPLENSSALVAFVFLFQQMIVPNVLLHLVSRFHQFPAHFAGTLQRVRVPIIGIIILVVVVVVVVDFFRVARG